MKNGTRNPEVRGEKKGGKKGSGEEGGREGRGIVNSDTIPGTSGSSIVIDPVPLPSEVVAAGDYKRPPTFQLVFQGQLDRISETRLDLGLVEVYSALGLTIEQIARLHGVPKGTMQYWKTKIPELAEAISRGQALAAAEVVKSLYRRCTGYTYTKTITEFRKGAGKDGGNIEIAREEEIHVEPDVNAIQYYLNNRDKANWQPLNKMDISLKDRKVIIKELSEMGEDELQKLAEEAKN